MNAIEPGLSRMPRRAGSVNDRSTRRARLRRACLAVCSGLGIFTAAQMMLGLALQTWLPEARDPAYLGKVKQLEHRLREFPSSPELVVMLGSSRTSYGFDGSLLETDLARAVGRPVVAYNLGRLGGGPLTECVYLRRLLAGGTRPSVLVVEVLPYMIGGPGTEKELESLSAGFLGPEDLALLRRLGTNVDDGLPTWVERSVPVYSCRAALLYKLAPSLLPRDVRTGCSLQWWPELNACGWSPLQRPGSREQIDDAHMKIVSSLLAGLEEGGVDRAAPSWRALEDIMVLARAEDIPVALIVMPEAVRLRQSYPDNWKRIWQCLEALADRYQCPLINARAWIDSEYFADPDHLDACGARLFTERLGRDHIRPLLLQIHEGGKAPTLRAVRPDGTSRKDGGLAARKSLF